VPACQQCKWLLPEINQCGIEGKYQTRSPIRNCIQAINLEYLDLLHPGDKVLEIGTGAWSPIKENSMMIGYCWFGIDILANYMGRPTIANILASVEAIPSPSKSFDWVIASQSMEHWEEYRVNILKA
jgi:hypothetical protein